MTEKPTETAGFSSAGSGGTEEIDLEEEIAQIRELYYGIPYNLDDYEV